MHPFQQDGSINSKGKQRQRDGTIRQSTGGGTASSAASTVTAVGSSGIGSILRSSTRLPTYVDYTALANGKAGHVNDSAHLPTDADDKLKKYYSVTSGSIRGRIIARANATKGWFGAALRAGVRAGFLETRFWLRAALLFLILLGFGVILFMRAYEIHVEIQFYNKDWIKRSIKPVLPLSGSCFAPSTLAASSYNTTLVNSPNYLTLNPGISMRFGNDCYHFAKQIPSIPMEGQELPEKTIYHLYWRADLAPLQERQILLLKSIFTTQDMSHASVVLWANDAPKLASNPLLYEITSRIPTDLFSVQQANFEELARSTPMAGHPLLQSGGSRDSRAWVDGDLARVLLLYNYGGIWIDMDTLILRSMRPLTEQEFVTQWDCYDKPYAPLNGAVMHFYRHSPYLCEMLYMMATGPAPRQGTTDWGSLLYHQLFRRLLQGGEKPFTVLPYCLTDGRSCRLDNRLPDPFEKDDGWIASKQGRLELESKLDSIFAIHLHNQWKRPFPKGGWINTLVTSKIEARWRELQLGNQ
ncbi:hypothetical protein P389DRAFT_193909 [Cystobasidium minutum MCA 4210]|uniref:uncharacterized protein n=1 Tax=Cystobasidium minutum MCA 4210 TaxID=1397322 RepID=UPI0034CD3770|eukprot:jgi/Rhomi1/193909/gm1.2123_g